VKAVSGCGLQPWFDHGLQGNDGTVLPRVGERRPQRRMPALARVALGTIGTLTSQMTYTAEDEIVAKAYAEALLDMTARYLEQHDDSAAGTRIVAFPVLRALHHD
jgi:hypothetical protein